MRRIHHVGIVVNRLEDAYRFYRDTLGLPLLKEATLPDQHVRAALLGCGESEIELLEPLEPSSGIGRFLARRGEGLHHLCFDTADIVKTLTSLKEKRVELLDEAPRPGLAGQIAFVHPRACCGVLVELATPAVSSHADPPAPLRLKRLVIGASDDVQVTIEAPSNVDTCTAVIARNIFLKTSKSALSSSQSTEPRPRKKGFTRSLLCE